jgi:hypothetical protein
LSGSQVLSGLKLEERENRPPCTINEGEAIDEQEEEKERGIDPSIVRKRDFRARGRMYHWMR